MRTGENSRSWWIALQTLLFSAIISAGNVFPRRDLSCADDLFFQGVLSTVEINLSEQEMVSLRQQPRLNVSCRVKIDGAVFERARVHLKGAGTFQPIDEKPSFTIKIEGLSGISKLHLNNSAEDGTFAQEKLGSELFAMAGIPAPRVGHARVKVNGRDRGLYVLKEGFGPEFLARNFSEGQGSVFDKDSLPTAVHLDTKLAVCGKSRRRGDESLNSLPKPGKFETRHLVSYGKRESFNSLLDQMLDTDQFVSFLAMEVLVCHWDGYGLANNNFRAYRNSTTGRLSFLPSGMDQLFGNPKFPLQPDMTGPLARALFDTAEGREKFTKRMMELAATFDGQRVARRAQEIALALQPAVSLSEFSAIREAVEDLSGRILARGNYLREQGPILTATRH